MRTKRMGVRQFVLHVQKQYGINPAITRVVMLAWRDWMVMHLSENREVYQEHVGTYKLTKRRTGNIKLFKDARGVQHNVTMPPFSTYVTFRAASLLRNTMKKISTKK